MSEHTQKINTPQKAGLTRIKKPRKGWHRADIKAALEKRGLMLSDLARAHGYSRSVITGAFTHSYPVIERIVADALGVQPWDIWPDRYNDYGQPVQPGNPNMVKRNWGGRKRNVELKVVK